MKFKLNINGYHKMTVNIIIIHSQYKYHDKCNFNWQKLYHGLFNQHKMCRGNTTTVVFTLLN